MGVSLQAYRIRIGTFNCSVKSKKFKATKVTNGEKLIPLKLIIVILLTTCFLLTAIQINQNSKPELKTVDQHLSHCSPVASWPASATCSTRPPPWPSWSVDARVPHRSQWTTWPGGTSYLTFKSNLPDFTVSTRNVCEKCGNDYCCGEIVDLQIQQIVTSPIFSGQWKLSQELGLDNNTLRMMPHQTAKDLNFLARMVNGNRKERGIKVQHWNKGPAHLVNKHYQIEALISEHRPHVLGLSEANFYNTHDIADINQDGYDVHLASTISKSGIYPSKP